MAKESLFARILVPIDASHASIQAVEIALTLAKPSQGCLVFYHALDLARAFEPAQAQKADLEFEVRLRDLRKIGHQLLAGATRRAQDQGIHSLSHVSEGEPVGAILEALKKEKPSLVVMGVGGDSGVRDRLGSVSAAVLASSYVPVLLVGEGRSVRVGSGRAR